ncbi:autotransporter domain-containing protein [Bradyrhizobium sp. Ce-3]|uniref:autotransporter domain-containing protein n=1 Tax=Bradyrhizobium sp. Ce-3 TaxID=2913970 RepID=UPI001FB9AED5|nr:autotransporter domain-containing protein [Bradyrhizobium sp. Ce-3]
MAVLLVMCWAAGFGREGVGISSASAQVSWVNPGTGDWTTPTNWSTGVVPTAGPADISNGGMAQISGVAVNVNGPGLLTVAQGNNSTGSLMIQSGGSLSFGGNGGIFIALGSGSTGTVTVAGPGSQLIAGPTAISSGTGRGTLNVSAGGSASFFLLAIGASTGAAGAVNVDGTGSSVTATTFQIGSGFFSRGTLTLSNGGLAVSSNTVQLGLQGSTGTINIGAAPGSAAVLPGSVTAPAVNLGTSTSVINFNHTATNYSFAPDITGAGSVAVYSGTTALTGTNAYTGPTTVNGGTLAVNGSIASSTTVNAGGTLGGNGTVGDTTINAGGTLAPGNSIGLLTVQGNLVFAAAASYLVEVSPANADRTNVTGTATLGGATVNASFAAGAYVARQYTIVNAVGGVNGTFNGPVNTNLPGGFKSSLSYDANNAFLNLALDFTPPPSGPNFGSGLNVNQQNVANTLVNYFNTTGGIPLVYGTLTPAGLTQASGELATASQQTTFDAMNLFMGLLTDPFTNRNCDAGSEPGARRDPEQRNASGCAATSKTGAYAMFTKAPPLAPVPFVPRWSVWAAGYGGSQSTSGNAVVGSNDTTSSVYGTAVGADYLLAPNTIAGFALAGGGTNFSIVNSGSGRSDLFQAGAYIRHTEGAAYVTAALAYGWQDITTNRTVTVAGLDQLRAEFNANTYSGRLEGGYRIIAPWTGGIGITPYAAGQFTTFDLPGYAEQAVVGSSAFALAYAAKSVTDVRSELGVRTDKSFLVQDGVLTLRTRFAWAHDYDPDRSIAATFQALPGAGFVVNGAAQASDSVLTTASIDMKWRNGWSAAATFEGEFSDVTSSYAGKGVVRYTW